MEKKKKICLVYDNPITKNRILANAAVVIIIVIASLEIYVLHNVLNSVKIIQNMTVYTSVGAETVASCNRYVVMNLW